MVPEEAISLMEDQKVSENGTCVVLVPVSLMHFFFCIKQSVSRTEIGLYFNPTLKEYLLTPFQITYVPYLQSFKITLTIELRFES